MRNEEVLRGIKEGRNTSASYIQYKEEENWIGHILRRNCLLKHVNEGKTEGWIEVTGRRGRKCNQPLDDYKKTRESWKLKEEILYSNLWRIRFGRGCGPVVRQTIGRMNRH
jgi:hypothetical protein